MKKYSIIFMIFVGVCLISWQRPVSAVQDNPKEVIAVRVMPNAEHLSPEAWYKRNIVNQGSPQSTIVDGYDAIRDGRSIYVAAANIVDGKIYTNIYIISFNQDSEQATQDIVGQMIKYWKFNLDITETFGAGNCLPDIGIACTNDADCQARNKSLICTNAHCTQYCQLTSECQSGQYCTSQKSKIIRDVRRMADLHEVVLALTSYFSTKKTFPALTAGSYLPNRTVSVWPSWNETFGTDVASAIKLEGHGFPVDPVNRLGSCVGYDAITCWNENSKKFATNFLSPVLPADSLAYAYSFMPKLGRYFLCAYFETDYAGLPVDLMCTGNLESRTADYPIVSMGSMTQAEGVFSGFFQVDSKLDINWAKTEIIPVEPDTWSKWGNAGWLWEAGATGLKISNTSVANQKKLSAKQIKLASGRGYQFFRLAIRVYDVTGAYGYATGTVKICQPKTCERIECGKIDDNCGGTLLCGDCADGKECVANKCIRL